MTRRRLKEIYECVVINGFYSVGRDQFLSSDISPEEMKELVVMAFASKPTEGTP
jgi:hypothetical protein